jgi:hypothetical protein
MSQDTFEVSARFGQMILARILDLELGASHDEKIISSLLSGDHRRRQQKLVDEQRAEAGRMRDFLSQAKIREPKLDKMAR